MFEILVPKKAAVNDWDLKKIPELEKSATSEVVEIFVNGLYTGKFLDFEKKLLPAVISLCAIFGVEKEYMDALFSRITPDLAGKPQIW
jgi:hypothetical protein